MDDFVQLAQHRQFFRSLGRQGIDVNAGNFARQNPARLHGTVIALPHIRNRGATWPRVVRGWSASMNAVERRCGKALDHLVAVTRTGSERDWACTPLLQTCRGAGLQACQGRDKATLSIRIPLIAAVRGHPPRCSFSATACTAYLTAAGIKKRLCFIPMQWAEMRHGIRRWRRRRSGPR